MKNLFKFVATVCAIGALVLAAAAAICAFHESLKKLWDKIPKPGFFKDECSDFDDL